MDKKYWENKEITVHWWNFGSKTLDYKGTYKGFLEKKGIQVKSITRNGVKGFRFTIPLSSCVATLDTFDSNNYGRCCDEAIKIFLSLLGDKSKFVSDREYFINWR